jgi:NADH-quinone oxidoreductase subunit J
MTLEVFGFWAVAVVLVASALAVVLSKNLFHAVLWLALALTSTAGVFLLLEAEFLAAVQLLLYAGGVITIAVFAIVVTERLVGEHRSQTNRNLVGGAVVTIALCGLIVSIFGRDGLAISRPNMTGDVTRDIGESVLTQYVLAFELLGLLMLVALIAAIYFARPEE